jgi:hypothetical protein
MVETNLSKEVRMGLGEAMRRLLDVEIRFRHGQANPELSRERDLLLQALNRVEIQLGFDCNRDGVPDTVEIFRQAAETSCCRITDLPGVAPATGESLLDVGSRFQELTAASRAPETPEDDAPRIILTGEDKPKPKLTGFFSRLFGGGTDPDKE